MRTDAIDVSSLVSYINDVKPFHSKLTSVIVEYQANDNLNVGIRDASVMDMQFSSVWELSKVSDGITTRYRIPAAVFPRYSDEFHQSIKKGVTDEVPGVPGAYYVPYNNGVEVFVNGILKTVNVDYTIDAGRTIVQFVNVFPVIGDKVRLNWAVVDRVFLGIGAPGSDIVWQDYQLEYSSVADGMEMFPYDISTFDSTATDDAIFGFDPLTGEHDLAVLNPFGKVRIVADTNGQLYYVFEFFNALPLDTKILLRVEQREAYNGWTQTKFAESVSFKDHIKFVDTVNVVMVDPGTWSTNGGLDLRFDNFTFDTAAIDDFSEDNPWAIDIGNGILSYHKLISVFENLGDTTAASISDSFDRRVTLLPRDLVRPGIAETNSIDIDYQIAELANTTVFENVNPLYDLQPLDLSPFDDAFDVPYIVMTRKNTTFENTASVFRESLNLKITLADGTEIIRASYTPDANGMVYVTEPSTMVEITHDYGYYPMVAIYLNGDQMYPQSLTYPTLDMVRIGFAGPRVVTIRLA